MFVYGQLFSKHLYIPALKGQLNRVIRVIEVKKVQSFAADNGADSIFFATSRKTCFFILKITKTNRKRSNLGQECAQRCELIFEGAFSYSYVLGPFKYYVIKEVGGWGQKMAIFDDLQ